ncbi:MAG: bifunctional demethylmenaquinone methyltransferase/2-methoxy-6-polyprenyl-1,4-benzoquinol methylase UbiE [Candidatus Marinimicrobia bacterium]|nr:bifunctional demethylmenaquinone methyltransferase/2-methoxy-6-polyprenyl-1,4-benzoquinol methylase UbiE [Candidatus Neomarinimicrobiota bacterium]
MPEFTHSGEDKKKYVQKMFDDISSRYDFLNHFLSLGIDFYWRKQLVKSLPKFLNQPILDVATGTGDVGFEIKKQFPHTKVIGLDYSHKMVDICRKKIDERNTPGFTVIQGDGENLPFENKEFSALTISFGFRNIGHYSRALSEFYRVLEDGGTLHILEFAEPSSKLFGAVYRWYFNTILPRIGALFSRSDAYRYLPESVEHFPPRDDLSVMIKNAGFFDIDIKDMTLGVVTLATAKKRI